MSMTIKNLPTLKGVFPTAAPRPKRDFLRENKLKLKDLQKHAITSKKTSQQSQYEPQQKCIASNSKRIIRENPSTISNTRINRTDSGCSCGVSKKTQATKIVRSKTHQEIEKKVNKCDKLVQTDDILDEVFLSNALKRCISKDVIQNADNNYLNMPFELTQSRPTTTTTLRENENVQNPASFDRLNNDHSNIIHESDNINYHYDGNENDDDDNSNSKKIETSEQQKQQRNAHNFHENYCMESKKLHAVQQTENDTIQQHDIKNKGRSTNIKIPKYLEREKREKELQKLREIAKDPNCPKGYYMLDENNRQEALRTAKIKFQQLIDEMNRMPLTCQTLRLRNRRIEIEKSLNDLEKTIQFFSKSKVYVREN